MQVNPKSWTVWVVTEGMAGTENQCLAITDALGVTPYVKRIGLRFPWSVFSPYLAFECGWTFNPALNPPWPDILITSGRKSIAASRYVKRKSMGKTFTLHLQDPRISPKAFDLVALPSHDPTRGDNVLVTITAPTRIHEGALTKARNDFAPLFAMKSSPRIAVLIGGNSKAHKVTDSLMVQLGRQLAALPGFLMITASRRTPASAKAALLAGLGEKPLFFWDGNGDNPYTGMLAWADYILVTADSVSMLSDAAATGKPTYVLPLEGGSPRLNAFHTALLAAGIARPFDGALDHWTYPAQTESIAIAQEIMVRMAHR
jgi:uncharacterized protein